MPALDIPALLKDMLTAAAGVLGKKWPVARDYATHEFQKLLEEARHIARLKEAGTISEEEGRLLMGMQCNACRAVLLAIKGIGLLVAQAVMEAALTVVKTALNTATGFALL